MPENAGYRKYLETEFSHISKALEALDKKVDEIKEQTTKTNSRVSHLEEFRDGVAAEAIRTRVPPADFARVEKKICEIENELKDVGFFARHPKFFVGMIVVLVVLSLVGGLGDFISKLMN